MSNETKQELRDKIEALRANAQSKNDTEGVELAVEAAAMIPPDDGDTGDPED